MVQLSVVIPCRNGAATVGETLDAVLAQTWDAPWELIFSDNGSTDASREVFLERTAGAAMPCRLVDTSDTPGKAHALNRAIAAARGRAILLCDADDVPAPGWLAAMGQALATRDLVGAAQEFARLNPGWVLEYRRPDGTNHLIDTPGRLPFAPDAEFVGGCAMGFSRRLFDAVGGFDPGVPIHDDVDFCLRAAAAGYKLHMVPEAVIHYRFRDDLRGIYRQAFSYEKHGLALARKYAAAPSPLRSMVRLARSWLRLARASLPLIPGGVTGDPLPRARLCWLLGQRMGRLAGVITYRMLPP